VREETLQRAEQTGGDGQEHQRAGSGLQHRALPAAFRA
jgi:hypothetical protein